MYEFPDAEGLRLVATHDQFDAVIDQMVERLRPVIGESLSPTEAAVDIAEQIEFKFAGGRDLPKLAALFATAMVRLAQVEDRR